MIRKRLFRNFIAFVTIGVVVAVPQAPAVAAVGTVYGPYLLATVGVAGLPLCLDNPVSTSNSTTMTISHCHGGANQQWYNKDLGSAGYWTFNAYSDKCLTVKGASRANGAAVVQYTCNDGANERWVYDRAFVSGNTFWMTIGDRRYETDKVFQIKNVNSSRCITVKNASHVSGNTLVQYDCSSPGINLWGQFPLN